MRTEEHVQRLATFGFTERQTAFLLLVLRHSGVCLARQYCAFGGIVRGQKTHDFFSRLVAKRLATPYACAHGQARVYHLHHKALYRAIGEPETRLRRPASLGRAVERLMVLDHLVAHRELTWLATEREKVEHFTNTGVRTDELPSITFTRGAGATTRYFPDRSPVGLPAGGAGYVFVYLATQDVPIDFRGYLHRHAGLLRRLRAWRIRLLVPSHLARFIPRYQQAFHEELAEPLRADVADEVRWYFTQLRSRTPVSGPRMQAARRDYSAPRFRALYRSWTTRGDRVIFGATSGETADAIASGEGGLECHVTARQYLHLSTLVGTA